jgi:hypothetical protein
VHSKKNISIVMWEIFRNSRPQNVTNGRFEIEWDGEVAYLDWAREHNFKVDIICSTVREYVAKHPEYSDLVIHRVTLVGERSRPPIGTFVSTLTSSAGQKEGPVLNCRT